MKAAFVRPSLGNEFVMIKKIVLSFISIIMILCLALPLGCSAGNTDKSLVFERIISGPDIPKYIQFGADGLICQFERVEHVYRADELKAYKTLFNTVMIFENPEFAEKRYVSIKRTHKDDAMIDGCSIYINQEFFHTDTISKLTFYEMPEYMDGLEYVLISSDFSDG